MLALSLASSQPVASQPVASLSIPPLPNLSLETYEAGLREPMAEAYRSAEQKPQDADRNGRLGMLLYANEQYELAAACFERAHALSTRATGPGPTSSGGRRSNLARPDRAVASLRTALQLRPGYLPARLMLAKSLLDAGHSAESEALYQAIVNELPETAEAYYGLGRIDAARGEHASAVRRLQEACALFPGFGAAHFVLARAYRDLGEQEKAREHLALYQKDKLGWPTVPDPLLAAILDLKTGRERAPQQGNPARGGRASCGRPPQSTKRRFSPTRSSCARTST